MFYLSAISQAIVVTLLYCLLFATSKSKDLKTDPGESYQFSVSTEISLDLKFFFP